jgi:hypothetical protein
MDNFLRKLRTSVRQHLTDADLISFLDGELSLRQTRRVRRHIENCWQCRARQALLQTTINSFVNYGNLVIAPFVPPAPSRRLKLHGILANEIGVTRAPWRWRASQTILTISRRAMQPIFATVLVVAAAAILLIFVWRRPSPRLITPQQFLARAVDSELTNSEHINTGVVFQRVAVRAPGVVFERTIYSDASKHRRAVLPKAHPNESLLTSRLASAGIDWERPLSSVSYRAWRSHLTKARDEVNRSAPGELTLTTTTEDGVVRQSSLTVREVDFHPVARNIVLLDDGERSTSIEIAELNYAVLDPRIVDESLFETVTPSLPMPAHTVHPASEAELDMTELIVRKKLHELGADLGEDIHIERSRQRIAVRGIVSSSGRLGLINASLHSLPHLVLSLHSPQDISQKRTYLAADGGAVAANVDLGPALLDSELRRDFPNEADRTDHIDHILAEADQCMWHSRALDLLLQRYQSLDDPRVRQIAADHLQIVQESTSLIAGAVGKLPPPPSDRQQNLTVLSQPERGTQLREESRRLEHDLSELLTAHVTDGVLPRSAASVVTSCQQHLKAIQELIASLR